MSSTPIDPQQTIPSSILIHDNRTFSLKYRPMDHIVFKIEDWVKFMNPVEPEPPICSCDIDDDYANEKYYTKQLFEYADLVENYLAVPVVAGKKTENEKFAGADYTTTIEALMPDGKALQMGTSHMLGQNFSKVFDIKFLDMDEQSKFVYQTSWGLSTRTIGALIMVHGDDKGIIVPPKIAPTQIVIVPILFKDTKDAVIAKAKELAKKMKMKYSVEIDLRDGYTPGWKFNEWEMKGIPLRIEFGPKDLENEQIVAVRRDTNEKIIIKFKDIEKKIEALLEDIQNDLFKKAKEFLVKSTIEAHSMDNLKKAISEKKMAKAQFCCQTECELKIKDEAEGATCRCIPFEQKPADGNCVMCNTKAKSWALFAKNY